VSWSVRGGSFIRAIREWLFGPEPWNDGGMDPVILWSGLTLCVHEPMRNGKGQYICLRCGAVGMERRDECQR
jgi:hypothetical protein